ncbi:hypothetical protein LN042_22970 [Kitasatospora sp. RB6PN24]|uniref:hypothetical protein n=1 Tax=Kitasatospora humi TaxID=2893891 RepID=UPI001E46CF77|nr:hypothetical protein [Kitasatospora humi]MCC9309898.1 hypothetical protein [Kitasatospora humi]
MRTARYLTPAWTARRKAAEAARAARHEFAARIAAVLPLVKLNRLPPRGPVEHQVSDTMHGDLTGHGTWINVQISGSADSVDFNVRLAEPELAFALLQAIGAVAAARATRPNS